MSVRVDMQISLSLATPISGFDASKSFHLRQRKPQDSREEKRSYEYRLSFLLQIFKSRHHTTLGVRYTG
jgi:hypothetical protein